MESVPESLEDKLIFMGGECNGHRIFFSLLPVFFIKLTKTFSVGRTR